MGLLIFKIVFTIALLFFCALDIDMYVEYRKARYLFLAFMSLFAAAAFYF